ncbi:hypothetical protein SHKM778_33460 [Streptomyces sp. KM77-8]|uniref:TIGR02678 family protein n=1 Tax=Streptomyces haneummycinicus TaxID=3074435 RepID=A0AAT9HHJ6_9ACTN
MRRHAAELREWFERNAGWALRTDADAARLRKTPGTLTDATHPAREAARSALPFTRRRYVLLCLALAALERGESQVALGRLAEQVVLAAADPELVAAGITFTLERRDERLDLAAVVRLLLRLGVLRRVAGHEDAYVSGSGDVLYDVRRRVLAGMPASLRGPSMVEAEGFEERLTEMTARTALDSDELRFRAIRWKLTRVLLDDPVLYYDDLADDELAYLTRQRGFITARINELTGLVPEVRAEGVAMVDPWTTSRTCACRNRAPTATSPCCWPGTWHGRPGPSSRRNWRSAYGNWPQSTAGSGPSRRGSRERSPNSSRRR